MKYLLLVLHQEAFVFAENIGKYMYGTKKWCWKTITLSKRYAIYKEGKRSKLLVKSC